jgi:hypothetical protein
MPNYIVKLNTPQGPRYLEWSSVVDAPVTCGMTRGEFRDWYKREYGASGMAGLEDRLRRADEKGTSSYFHASAEDQLQHNRAGNHETTLTLDQIVDFYCVRRGVGDPPTGSKR